MTVCRTGDELSKSNMAEFSEKKKESVDKRDTLFFICIVVLGAILVRCCVSLSPYSGAGKPPMFGDYEAQRHWMEITFNLPVQEWYVNSSSNDLMYWGLDYPPLTAYHSWLCGYIANKFDPKWVALNTSRGFESTHHKLFMRYTVLVADVLVYFPATLILCFLFYKPYSNCSKISFLLLLLLHPGLILIDHGHFQYNCVSLGLALWGILGVIYNRDILGSIAFTLALNYKQMELYHALPFFSFLLGKALKEKTWAKSVFKICCLGITVILTVVLCWLPFLRNIHLATRVLDRLFPFGRGLYEDKVANIWCSLSVVIKLKNIFSMNSLISLSGFSTLVFLFPSNVMLLRRPTAKSFLFALVNSSLAFFLFSFQVHEKSILLVTLPASLLLPWKPLESTWFLAVATFSMVPLLEKDGLLLAYIPTMLLFLLVSFSFIVDFKTATTLLKSLLLISFFGCFFLHLLSRIIAPPRQYPDIFPVLISVYSCSHFSFFLLYYHYLQYNEYCSIDVLKKKL